MGPELVQQLEALNANCAQVKPGDIATLAGVLEQCETLRQVGELEGNAGLQAAAEGLGEHLKRMIMGETSDDAQDLVVLRETAGTLHAAFSEGRPLRAEDFPAALQLQPWPTEDGAGAAPRSNGSGAVEPDAHLQAALDGADAEASDPADVLHSTGGTEGAFAADAELLAEYLSEQRGRLEEIEGRLLTLERSQDDAALADLRRALHTIKGDSGFLGLSAVARISHAAESYLEVATYPYDLEPLFRVKDWLASAFADLAATSHLGADTQASLRRIVRALEAHVAKSEGGAEPPASATSEPEAAGVPGDTAGKDLIAELVGGEAPEPEPTDPLEAELDAAPAPPKPAPVAAAPANAPPAKSADRVLPEEPYFQLTADESLLVDFITESKEHLDVASAQLLGLESEPENEEAINSVFRAFHTVKGIAGFLNLQEVAVLAHGTENLLEQVRRGSLPLTAGLIDLVFEALDWMTRLIGNVRKGLQEGGRVNTEPDLVPLMARIKAAAKGETSAENGERPKRLGEILVSSGAVAPAEMEAAAREASSGSPPSKLGEVLLKRELVKPSQVHAALREQATQTPSNRKSVELKETLRVDYERLENMINTIGELVLAEAMISQDDLVLGLDSEGLDKKLYNLRQVSRKLQELGTTIRMVPISGTFQKMARLVRDLSRKSNKPINFTSIGDETELDRAYVDLIADPLVHMIRNAVDHGIENPAERREKGKAEVGRIELRAFHEGGNIHVQVRDDGKGLDVERIWAKAVERGLRQPEEREKMSEQDIYQLIFLPGFSTAAQVTEVSGRGVGMDVVRRNIAELRGQVQIATELGKGTTFRVILPLTLALIDGMLVRVGAERFIFPVLSVVESARPSREMLNTIVGKGEMISLRGRQLPLYRLGRLFNVANSKEDVSEGLVVVVENEGRQVGIMVDDLIGIQQTVIKSLGSGLFDTKGLSGGSIMADGTVGLIVDVSGLISMARTRDLGSGDPSPAEAGQSDAASV